MATKRRGAQRKEDEKKIEEIMKVPIADFDSQDLSERQRLVYECRRRGLSPAETAIRLGTSEPSVRATLNAVAERFLTELDDMRLTFVATNISRLEWIISRLVGSMETDIEDGVGIDKDVVANLMKAIALESKIYSENINPPQQGNTTNVNIFTPTLNSKSKLYQDTIPQMNPETVEHYHPDVYAKHKDIIEDPAIKRLENLLPAEVDDDE